MPKTATVGARPRSAGRGGRRRIDRNRIPDLAHLARIYPISSDDATGVLEANAVIRGNLLLRGWSSRMFHS